MGYTIREIKKEMKSVLVSGTKIYGPMDLIYKTAANLNVKDIPYPQFDLWWGVANKLIKKEKQRSL